MSGEAAEWMAERKEKLRAQERGRHCSPRRLLRKGAAGGGRGPRGAQKRESRMGVSEGEAQPAYPSPQRGKNSPTPDCELSPPLSGYEWGSGAGAGSPLPTGLAGARV